MTTEKTLTKEQTDELLKTLQSRFEKNVHRHDKMKWDDILQTLKTNTNKLWSLHQMEITGGEPDVVGYDQLTNTYTFFDCVQESPKERRSLCYDQKALEARKQNKPKGSAVDMATRMGTEILTEEQYRQLQSIQIIDTKTSTWLKTPNDIRALGGAIFADYRYGKIFVYHNGADSYYSGRGFRCVLQV